MVVVVSIHISIRGGTGVLHYVKALELRELEATRFIQRKNIFNDHPAPMGM